MQDLRNESLSEYLKELLGWPIWKMSLMYISSNLVILKY